jgi:hypothetical protein
MPNLVHVLTVFSKICSSDDHTGRHWQILNQKVVEVTGPVCFVISNGVGIEILKTALCYR